MRYVEFIEAFGRLAEKFSFLPVDFYYGKNITGRKIFEIND
jgi:hypothetical protein